MSRKPLLASWAEAGAEMIAIPVYHFGCVLAHYPSGVLVLKLIPLPEDSDGT